MSELTVLLSAMHLEDYHFIDSLKITTDAVVINQCDYEDRVEIDTASDEHGRRVLFLSSTERGLALSRNKAIEEAISCGFSDIAIFCDNDCVYESGYSDKITGYFKSHPETDIAVFFIKRPERSAPVFENERSLGYMGAMKIFSPEIAVRCSSLQKYKLRMNEFFGAGARYGMGEENIFLFDAIGKGMKVQYVPFKIAELAETESTWFKGYTDKFFIDRGAGYYAMSRRWYWLLCLQFAVRKYKLYKSDNSVTRALGCMFKGADEYRDLVKNKLVR